MRFTIAIGLGAMAPQAVLRAPLSPRYGEQPVSTLGPR